MMCSHPLRIAAAVAVFTCSGLNQPNANAQIRATTASPDNEQLKSGTVSTQKPLVYEVEDTGASLPKPVLPDLDDLPIIRPLTDPFEWSDKSGRSTKFEDWKRRRAEIKAEIEHYGIG